MDTTVFAIVLAAAAAHALINCALKKAGDPFAACLLLPVGGGLVALPVLLATGLPAPEAWPSIAASTGLGLLYCTFLGRAYHAGDVGTVFPLARGLAPLFTLCATALLLGEVPLPREIGAIAVVFGGIVLVLAASRRQTPGAGGGVGGACLVVAAALSAFTVIDAVGVRLSGSVLAYTASLYVAGGITALSYGLCAHRRRLAAQARQGWPASLGWGAVSLGMYACVMWAMTAAPVALVAALRETSVLFAVLVAAFWLKEPLRPARVAGVGMVGLGLVLVKTL